MTRKEFDKLKIRDFGNGAVRDEIALVFKERDNLASELKIEKMCREGTKHAVVDSVGGVVEGRPTHALNYLQRLRELVEKERQLDALRPYADHTYHCDLKSSGRKCSCGYDAVLQDEAARTAGVK